MPSDQAHGDVGGSRSASSRTDEIMVLAENYADAGIYEPAAKLKQVLRAAVEELVDERDALARSLRAAKVVIAGLEDRAIRTAQTFAATAQRAADVDGEREANAILTAEVEALRANAERYLHLRNNSATYPSPSVPIQLIAQPSWSSQFDGYRKHLDAAIDAAMKEKSNG